MTPKQLLKWMRHTPKGLLVLACFSVGLILRGPMSAVAPIATQLESALGIDAATVGLLSGIPVFCYAAFSPVASWLIGKKGLEFTFITAISLSCISIIIRGFGGFEVMVASTVCIGAATALGNIAIPLIAARDFPKKFSIVSGLTGAAMNVGNFAAFALTVPITAFVGYRLALMSWAIVCLGVLWVWIAYIFRKRRGASRKSLKRAAAMASTSAILVGDGFGDAGHPRAQNVESKPLESATNSEPIKNRKLHLQFFTYGVCGVFICQCIGFFGFAAWLPAIFESRGLDPTVAGLASSLFHIFGILGSVAVHPLIKRLRFKGAFLLVAICWISLPFGLLFIPQVFPLWLTLAGFAQGANYIVMFSAITAWSENDRERRVLSAATQMSAYFVAGVTPSVMGALHTSLGSWTAIIAVLLGVLCSMLVIGLLTYSPLDKQSLLNGRKS